MTTKKPWQSKTLWINLLLAIAAIAFPPAAEFIKNSPEIVGAVFAGINVLLRLVSKDAIQLTDETKA
jgi:hypothetical protein